MPNIKLSPTRGSSPLRLSVLHFWNLKQWALVSLGHYYQDLIVHLPICPLQILAAKFFITPRIG